MKLTEQRFWTWVMLLTVKTNWLSNLAQCMMADAVV